jgi:hypothetical protein
MPAVAGATVVLAGAVMLGGGAIANAVLGASNIVVEGTTCGLLIGGAIVGLIGFGILFTALSQPATGDH